MKSENPDLNPSDKSKNPIEYRFFSHNDKQNTIEFIESICKGKNIVLFDFCFEENIMEMLMKECKSFCCYDHHESSEQILKKYEMNCVYDKEHSGVYLAWRYFFDCLLGKLNFLNWAPSWVEYIEARDLFKFERGDKADAFSSYCFAAIQPGHINLFKCLYKDWALPSGTLLEPNKFGIDFVKTNRDLCIDMIFGKHQADSMVKNGLVIANVFEKVVDKKSGL